jgi:hypothetical protein
MDSILTISRHFVIISPSPARRPAAAPFSTILAAVPRSVPVIWSSSMTTNFRRIPCSSSPSSEDSPLPHRAVWPPSSGLPLQWWLWFLCGGEEMRLVMEHCASLAARRDRLRHRRMWIRLWPRGCIGWRPCRTSGSGKSLGGGYKKWPPPHFSGNFLYDFYSSKQTSIFSQKKLVLTSVSFTEQHYPCYQIE